MNESVEAWLWVAEKDIRMLEKLLEDEELTDGVMFHAQQAVEKCLKALLEQLEVPIPRVHDLRRLHTVVSNAGLLLEINEETLGELSDFYIASRYPVDSGSPALDPPSTETADTFRLFAKAVHDQTTKKLQELEKSGS